MRRLFVALGVVAVSIAALAAGAASATGAGHAVPPGHWAPVRMTVSFPWDGVAPESVVASTISGCAVGDVVVTVIEPDQQIGDLWIFTGRKTFSCAAGEFTLSYRSYRLGDATSALGTWVILNGTGAYAGMAGTGIVQGRYTYDGGQKTGIVDSYAGLVSMSA